MKLRVSEYFVSRKKREGRKGKKTLMKKKLAERQFRSSKKKRAALWKISEAFGISRYLDGITPCARVASRGIARHCRSRTLGVETGQAGKISPRTVRVEPAGEPPQCSHYAKHVLHALLAS